MNQADDFHEQPSRVCEPYLVRTHRDTDMHWVIRAHGALYAREYQSDATFEDMVGGIVANFVRDFDARHERCWIAEQDGANIGSVFLVRESEQVAKLRLLIVEPGARGLGVGKRLVDECIRFARQSGYRTLTLWTNDILVSARHIYLQAGFVLVTEQAHHSFGHDLVGQNWELGL